MSAALLTLEEVGAMIASPVKDTAYARKTRLGPHVEAFLASKLASQQYRPKTVENYRYQLAQMAVLLIAHEPDDVTVEDLERVLASFPERSAGAAHAALSSFWRWMRRRGHCTQNPAELLDRPKKRKPKKIEIFTEPEVKRLEALPLRDGVLMSLLFDSGLRLGEACGLQLLHVDLEQEELVVVEGKGGKGRIVDLSHRCIQRVSELALLDGLETTDYLWYRLMPGRGDAIARDVEVSRWRFYRWWKETLLVAGVRYRRPHTTRHTFATRWLRDGARLEVLTELMGHESIATTKDLYGHLQRHDLKAEVRRLELLRFPESEVPANEVL